MKIFNKILVAVDFSDASIAALAKATTLAKLSGASLDLVHVVDDVAARYLEYPFSAIGQAQADVTEAAEQQLAGLAQGDELRLVSVRPVVLTSTSPAAAIANYADEEQVDLIVMGRHGRSAVMRMLVGSVAERVARTAHCAVMMIPSPVARRSVEIRASDVQFPVHA